MVAFDQVYTYNRFGAFNPGGMIYALRRDVVPITGTQISPGNVQLRPDKRPRPITLRVNEGDCLRVTFQNLLTPTPSQVEQINFTNQPDEQPYTRFPIELRKNNTTTTRSTSMHVNGLDYVNGPDSDDGANVGANASSLAASGQTKIYTWYARQAGPVSSVLDGRTLRQRRRQRAGWPRSLRLGQRRAARREVVSLASDRRRAGRRHDGTNLNGTPKINYEKLDAHGNPILNMRKGNEIIHTDLNAIITGFTEDCAGAPPSGTCGKPFREFTVVFHDELKAVQAFSEADRHGEPVSPLDAEIFHGVRDGFGVNYGASGRRDADRQSPAARPGGRLRRLQVRRVLPRIVGERRPGDGREDVIRRDSRKRCSSPTTRRTFITRT